MNILWTTNVIMPEVAKRLGIGSKHPVSWIEAMSERLKMLENVSLAIVSRAPIAKLEVSDVDGIKYILLPSDCNEVDYWDEVFNLFKPDVIHVYGTESDQSYQLLKNHSDMPIIVSLQGILSEYQHHYYAGVDIHDMVRFTTLRDILKKQGFFAGKKDFKRRSKKEQALLKMAKNVEGRSTWDRVSALNINPNLHYYYCPRMIRTPFYEGGWDLNKVERHSIFVHQGNYPVKGLHIVLPALAQLRKRYPDVKLYISGQDLYKSTAKYTGILPYGYPKYLKYLIEKYDLRENLVFTGQLNAGQLADYLKRMNVVVLPSSIENAPNSIVEAQLVGVPVVASFVGGNMEMVHHDEDGYLYCYNEPNMLTEYVSRIFENDDLAKVFSVKARAFTLEKHDPKKLVDTLMDIYSKIQ